RAPYATGRDAPPGRLYVDGAPAFRWPCRRHRVCCDENKLPSLLRRGIAKSTTTSGQNLPTLSLAGIGETNETRETHETQNIRLVFWGLQKKHEGYREVGVGLALPFTLFQITEGKLDDRQDSVRVAQYMPFCGMCATSDFRRAACLEPLIAHIAKTAMYAPPLISGISPGGASIPFSGMCPAYGCR